METAVFAYRQNTSETSKEKDEDFFYDERADEKDESWMRRRRMVQSDETNVTSDAVLNCPCCFSLLCLDCQQHEVYKTQYRSMFVMNCTVDAGNPLQEEARSSQEGNKEQKEQKEKEDEQEEEMEGKTRKDSRKNARNKKKKKKDTQVYLNVRCSICQTQVAMYDEEQVYHFFNVLASHP